MGLIGDTIRSVLNGISQQNPALRDSSQNESQVNAVSDITRGLVKRPPTEHLKTISTTPGTFAGAFVHNINRGVNDRFRVVVLDGDVKVFNTDTGLEVSVIGSSPFTYLDSTTPDQDFRATTLEDRTIILNKTQVVSKGTTASPQAAYEALIWVRAADYATEFTITINDTSVTFTTPDGAAPETRGDISTHSIAWVMVGLLNNDLPSGLTASLVGGSLIRVVGTSADFTASVSDGLADEGLMLLKGQVQRFSDLPPIGVDGFTIEVLGDDLTDFDNFWVRFDGETNTWEEVAKPGEVISLDASTMPHQLVNGGEQTPQVTVDQVAFPPSITETGGTAQTQSPTTALNGTVTGDVVLSGAQENFAYINVSDGGGATREYTLYYDLNTYNILQNSVWVEVWVNDGVASTNWAKIATSEIYEGGANLRNESLKFNATLSDNWDIRVRINHELAELKNVAGYAVLSLQGDDGSGPLKQECLNYTTDNDKQRVEFDASRVYPGGVAVSLTVDGNLVTVTPSTDLNASGIAAEFNTDITALANHSSTHTPGDGFIVVDNTSSSSPPVITYNYTFDSATTFYADDLGVANIDELVGSIVVNVTDGSQGVITSNHANRVTCGGLTGGAFNVFSPGHRISIKPTGSFFVWKTVDWDHRAAGDDITNPFPSFVDSMLDDVFFHQGRLGLASGEAMVLSESGTFTNFFRKVSTSVLDADPVDFELTDQRTSKIHSVLHWNRGLIAFTRLSQFRPEGQPLFSPSTVSVNMLSSFESVDVRPVVVGPNIYFGQSSGGYTQIMEYYNTDSDGSQSGGGDADRVTTHVPKYLKGSLKAMAGSASLGMLVCLTDDDQSKLFVYNFHRQGRDRLQSAWHEWQFSSDTEILNFEFLEESLALVVRRHDVVTFETLDLRGDVNGYVDSRMADSHADVSVVYAGGDTTWTLPFEVREPGIPLTVVQALDAFTGAGDVTAHTPDQGFGGWTAISGFTTMAPLSGGAVQLGGQALSADRFYSSNDVVSDGVEVFGDLTRKTMDTDVTDHIQLRCRANSSMTDYIMLRIERSGATQVKMSYARIASSSTVDSDSDIATFDLAASASIRVGLTLSGTSLTFWTEPAGGGTRTQRGTATVTADTSTLQRYGFSYQSQVSSRNVMDLDNFTVQTTGTETDNDGTLVVVRQSDNTVLTTSRPANNQITVAGQDLSSTDVWLGIQFTETLRLSTIYPRNRDGLPITSGRFQLRRLQIGYQDTQDLTVTITQTGKTASFPTRVLALAAPADGELVVPVQGKNDQTTITLSDNTPRPTNIQYLNWEGWIHIRNRR